MARGTETILSAGIDIGTSTTKIVISKLSLRNTAGLTHMPRIEITEKEMIHKSPVIRTPFRTEKEIDMKKVEEFVRTQYQKADINAEEIKTGAVIITGESSTKSNAQELIGQISEYAGDFLVATAGPDLESIIAAKGSGAVELSQSTSKTVANIDIGGGTANVAVYQYGKLLGTCTLHVGGKLIEWNKGKIEYISPFIKEANKQSGINLQEGDHVSDEILKEVTNLMAQTIVDMCELKIEENHPLLLGELPNWEKSIDIVTFSGGVSECMYYPDSCNQEQLYNDVGGLLAKSIINHDGLSAFEVKRPKETVRATVLGAGTQTTEISGSTILVDNGVLPLHNIPVYNISFEDGFPETLSRLPEDMKRGIDLYDPHQEGVNFALYLYDLPVLGFKDIQRLAKSLVEANQQKVTTQPLLVVFERDLAKSLGQTIQVQYPDVQLVCIDQIKVEHGDYLDIGNILTSGVAPVVLKTLTFQ
ncbi:ethanolamine utilization protein [Pontibacillus yanchengensis]|uniref:Ethanolamine utilization protein n=1 Tax=Pontibacillus yanchengensis TaxID=462910 RepID=A0ACC7VM81_9BACI|nr:ethanolamine ammonia-lyase reactivating factor EutA [Pontibacillus yanchengensis]MYL55471.1 ethanolamine utilization protein [Pontibacillus yanchengensis]